MTRSGRNTLHRRRPLLISNTTVNNRFTRTTIDGLGRVARTESADSGGVVQSVVDTTYGPAGVTPNGMTWKMSLPYAPGATPIYTVTTYDGLGRT